MQPADSYSSAERRLLATSRRFVLAVFRPVVIVLARLGVTPNMVSLSQVPVGGAIFLLIPYQPRLAFILMVVALVLDGIDGALARHTGKVSPYGALVDQYADHAREILVVAGLAYWGALNGAWATLYALTYTGSNVTLYICNVRGVPIPVAVKTALVFYPALFLYLWFGVNYLDLSMAVIVTVMTMVIVYGLWKLRSVFDGTNNAPAPAVSRSRDSVG